MCLRKYSPALLAVLLLTALSLPAQEPSVIAPPEEIWANVNLAGQAAGYYHEKTERDNVGRILTLVETIVVINRLNSRVEIRSRSEYVESKDAKLIAIKSETSSSKQSTVTEVSVGEGLLLIRTTTGGKTYDRKVPYTGTLLGPEAVRRAAVAGLKLPGDTISLQIFVPELGSIANVKRRAIGTELVSLEGKQFSGLRVEDAIDKLPGKTHVWLNSTGRLLRQVQETPFGEIDISRTNQKPGDAKIPSGNTLPSEAYSRAVARANIRLPHERSIEQMKIRITHRKPELGWPDLEADNQRVLEKTPESLVLEMWRPMPGAKKLEPAMESSSELAPFLAANPLLQSDDTGVRRILREIGPLDSDVFQSSLALQRWTAENLRFDSGIAVASASEVARDRKGTCFGYSVLLGSLARAAGIPSRFKMGYVYASGMWGGHAWVEVLVGNDWIPIDAAAYSPGPADAARFSAFTSSLEEGISTGIGALVQLYGNLDIQILEYTLKGRRMTVPVDAPPHVTGDNTYRNQWIGLTVVKPDSFRFTRLDAVWPDYTVVGMEGPQHQSVEIQKLPYSPRNGTEPGGYLRQTGIFGDQRGIRVSNFSGLETSSPDDAGLAFVDEDQVWIVRAKGADAPSVLHEIAFRMTLSR